MSSICVQYDDSENQLRSLQLAKQLLHQHGAQLTSNLIQASVFQLPSHTLPTTAEFLATLASVMKQVLTLPCRSVNRVVR